jgi:hypothetical protein
MLKFLYIKSQNYILCMMYMYIYVYINIYIYIGGRLEDKN